jgi:2-keto-3-deoxy-L-rhamnonate aldolase RhmA
MLAPQGLIFPHVRDAREAAELVSWCRYKPMGTRGSGLARGYLRHQGNEYDRRQQANADVVCIMIVEDLEGAGNLDAILAVDGVTGVAIGPGDISMELGASHWNDPRVAKVLDDMSATIRSHDGAAQLRLCLAAQDMPDLARAGANMVIVNHDAYLIKAMYQSLIGDIRRAARVKTKSYGEH